MTVAVIGSGAMGSLFGGLLTAAGEDVVLVDVWEEHVRAMNDDGLRLVTPAGEERTVPVTATTDPASVGTVDLALVFVKSTHTREAIADADALIGPDTDVLTLQNGLGNPEAIAESVPESNVVAGVTAHGATLEGPGHVRHAGRGATSIGRYFTANDDRVHEIADLLTRAGVETDVADAIQDAIWEKVLVNVGINAATALARVDNGLLADTEPGARLLTTAVEEAADVARAEGHTVRDDVVEYVSDVASATGTNRSSMRQDVERGRRTEIERLNGAVVARADDHDIAVPVNRTLTDLVRLTERGYDPD